MGQLNQVFPNHIIFILGMQAVVAKCSAYAYCGSISVVISFGFNNVCHA